MADRAFPTECSFLKEGQQFVSRKCEDDYPHGRRWYEVRLQACDIERGYVCGDIVRKRSLTGGDEGVVTFWEGEIIDNRNYTFYSSKWNLSWEAHRLHWSSIPELRPLRAEIDKNGGASLDLADCPHMFMRWKEHVPNYRPEPCLMMPQLYHVCFGKNDGRLILCRYLIPDLPSSPGSRFELFPRFQDGISGYTFATYQFQ